MYIAEKNTNGIDRPYLERTIIRSSWVAENGSGGGGFDALKSILEAINGRFGGISERQTLTQEHGRSV